MVVFATARKLKALIIGADAGTVTSDGIIADLKAASVPITFADCRICPDPCDEGHVDYPARFDVDMESFMLGSVKPYRRQVVISTGKSDWDREVTEAPGSLATYISEVQSQAKLPSPPSASTKSIHGIFSANDTNRVAILNGSHKSLSDEESLESVLVFPDYKVVTEVPCSLDGAKGLWDSVLNPPADSTQESTFKTWVLPYSCIILLCSHKRRDNRCSIASVKLEEEFTRCLHNHDWEIHTQLEDLASTVGPSLESLSTPEEQTADVLRQLKALPAEQKALILKNSHTGGHKYAGNCIIYTPQGSGVWYGRVTTHEVESIVKNTILGGEVLPPLLRGGLNLARPGCKNLQDW